MNRNSFQWKINKVMLPIRVVSWFILIMGTYLISGTQIALALQVIEKDRVYFYFPQSEEQLANRLSESCLPITEFLKGKGLPVTKPLHIVLDDDLDTPKPEVILYPHREIRIPLKAPGILENGYTEPDPWMYYLFKGLSVQGIYSERSGLPAGLHKVFGEIVSPNLILPDWAIDGLAHLLFEEYMQRLVKTPYAQSIFTAGAIPDLDKVSNHPEIWPGRGSYRIYGRPFIRWLNQQYGWVKIAAFFQLHGAGIIPIEIDLKAKRAFGKSWHELWQAFRSEHQTLQNNGLGQPIIGYWPDPLAYWSDEGVFPGLIKSEQRGRYGYMDNDGWLWLSQYEDNIARIISQRQSDVRSFPREHVWDPGPGDVAVTRKGHRPLLLMNAFHQSTNPDISAKGKPSVGLLIPAPPGVIQLSGPVMDDRGRVAVAGNLNGNWDIWLYDKKWYRFTTGLSIEMDPWFTNGKLLFSSNHTGRFQIHTIGMKVLTEHSTAAMFPRQDQYLVLGKEGWQVRRLEVEPLALPDTLQPYSAKTMPSRENLNQGHPYSPFKSLIPNYILPDLYIDTDNFQIGASTEVQDVSKNFTWNAGIRYAIDEGTSSWRFGVNANEYNVRATHYKLDYTTARQLAVNEYRYEAKVAWAPSLLQGLEMSANWLRYAPVENAELTDQEYWGTLTYGHENNNFNGRVTIDYFNNSSRSLYGEILYRFGKNLNTIAELQAGKTWGELKPGHNTFRIGGESGEGLFTQRPNRLFSLRGFDTNVLDAGLVVKAGIEVFWPLARLQTGYRTLPLFLHNITVGTFIDGGFAAVDPNSDDILIGAGFEVVTGMELAWGFMADFRMGMAWPLRQPDDLDQEGPVFLIQLGHPL